MSRSIGTVKIGFLVDSSSLSRGMSRAAGTFKSFSSSMSMLGMGMGLAITAPLAIIGAQAIKLASDLEVAYVKIKNLAGVSQGELNKMKGGIRGMSDSFGISQIELAGGAYAVASAGIRDAATALDIVKVSAKGSLQGMGEVEQIARGITAVLNVYGEKAYTASRAGEILYNTVKEGAMEIDSLSKTIGRVLAPAQSLGISLEEVGANLATYTRAGVNAEEAITGLRNLMKSAQGPTVEFSASLTKAGLSTEWLRDSIRNNGLARTLVDLTEKINESGQTIDDLFGNVRGLNNILSVANEQGDTYVKIVDGMIKSTNDLNTGAEEMGNTLSFKMNQAKIAIENLKIELGERLAPYVTKFASIIRGLADDFSSLTEEQKKTIIQIGILGLAIPFLLTGLGQISTIIGGVVAPAFKTAILVLAKFWALSIASQGSILALAGAAFMLWTYWDDILGVVDEWKLLTSKSYRQEKSKEALQGTILRMEEAYNEELKKGNKIEADRLKLWIDQVKAGDRKATDKAKLSKYGIVDARISGISFKEDIQAAWERTKAWIIKQTPLADFTQLFDLDNVDKWLDAIDKKVGKGVGMPKTKDSIIPEQTPESIDNYDLIKSLTGYTIDEWGVQVVKLTDILDKVNNEISGLQGKIDSDILNNDLTGIEKETIEAQITALNDLRKAYGLVIDTIRKGKKSTDGVEIFKLIGRDLKSGYDPISKMLSDIDLLLEKFQSLGEIDWSPDFSESGIVEYIQSMIRWVKIFGDESVTAFEKFSSKLKKLNDFADEWGETINSLMGLMNELGNFISQLYDNKISKIEESYQKEIDAINGGRMSEKKKADAIARIEKEKEEKIAKEKRRQAIFDKSLAIANIILGTAQSVAKASDPILAAIAAASGAIALATAIATPIPKYAKGGIFKGRSIGEIGEYAGVRHNPEVVSPLSELKKLIGGRDVYVHGEIDGYKLQLVQARSNIRYARQ